MYITWSEAWQKTTVLVTRLFGRFVSRSVEAAKSGRDSRFRRRSGCFVASKKPDNAEIPGQASRYRPMSCPVRDFLPHSADAIARALKARSIWRVLVVRCVAAARGLRVPDDARRLWHVHARDRSQHPVGIAFEQAHVVAREVGDGQKAPVGRRRKVPRPLPSGRNVAAPRNPSLAIHREDDQLVASAHRRVQLPPVGRETRYAPPARRRSAPAADSAARRSANAARLRRFGTPARRTPARSPARPSADAGGTPPCAAPTLPARARFPQPSARAFRTRQPGRSQARRAPGPRRPAAAFPARSSASAHGAPPADRPADRALRGAAHGTPAARRPSSSSAQQATDPLK